MPERDEWSSEIAAWILEPKETREKWQRLAHQQFYTKLSWDDCDDVVAAAAQSLQTNAMANPSGPVCDAWGEYKDGEPAHIESTVRRTLKQRGLDMVRRRARLAEDDMPEGLPQPVPEPIGSPEADERIGEWLNGDSTLPEDLKRFLYLVKALGIQGHDIPVGFSRRYRSADEALASFRVFLSPKPEEPTKWFKVLDRMVEDDTPRELMTYCNLTDGQYRGMRRALIAKFGRWLTLNQVDFKNIEGGLL